MISTANDPTDSSRESDQGMISKVARIYVILLFVLELLLIAVSLLMNVSVWVGWRRFADLYRPVLFMGSLLTAFPIAFLARREISGRTSS